MKRFIRIGLVIASALIALCLLLAAFAPSSPRVRQSAPTTIAPVAPTATAISPVETAARSICKDRFISVVGGANAVITCHLHNIYGLTGAAEDLSKLAQVVMADGSIQTMRFVLIGQFRDANGNSKKDTAIAFTVTRPLFAKINWQGMGWIGFARKVNAGEDGSSVIVSPGARAAWADLVN